MSAEQAPGRAFDAWSQLKFSIGELQALAVQLGVHLHSDQDNVDAIMWDDKAWRAADLLERCLADLGGLAATYVRLVIYSRYGHEPP